MLTVKDLYDLSHSLAGDYLAQFTYPWEALAGISDLILEIGKQLPQEEYYHPADWDGKVLEDVWVAKDATVFKTAYLHGPCIIGHRTEVRQCAFIRGSALVGNDCVVGNSTELKNVILFDNVQVPHYNYVGDSILGYKAHMGAGLHHLQRQERQASGGGEGRRGAGGDRPQKGGRHAGQPGGSGLQQRPESRHRYRPGFQRVSHILRPGCDPGEPCL